MCCHKFISNSRPGITGKDLELPSARAEVVLVPHRVKIQEKDERQHLNVGFSLWGWQISTLFTESVRLEKISRVIKSNLIPVSSSNDKIMPFSQGCKRADSSKTCGSICIILQINKSSIQAGEGKKNAIVMNCSGRALQMLPSVAIIYFLAEIHCCAARCENPEHSWSM